MLIEKKFFSLLYLGNKHKHDASAPIYHRISTQDMFSDYGKKRSGRKTKYLIKTLLAHGARASRISQPRTRVGISVFMPDGEKAVRLRVAK